MTVFRNQVQGSKNGYDKHYNAAFEVVAHGRTPAFARTECVEFMNKWLSETSYIELSASFFMITIHNSWVVTPLVSADDHRRLLIRQAQQV
mmetsp:Transcript_13476/g.24172  ORF Transcript_13476/g.24172 Transcript_13476/m.24172 type:complete len:91 (-) Transcript_13476:324-596(-)